MEESEREETEERLPGSDMGDFLPTLGGGKEEWGSGGVRWGGSGESRIGERREGTIMGGVSGLGGDGGSRKRLDWDLVFGFLDFLGLGVTRTDSS